MSTAGNPKQWASSAPIRVLVVDSSRDQREMLLALFGTDPELQVAGWAADGDGAIRATARLKPNVILMNLRLPQMDGVEVARRIMQETPTPIVVMTSSPLADDQQTVQAALQAGVLAVVTKPLTVSGDRHAVDELLRTVKSMAQVKVIRRWSAARLGRATVEPPAAHAVATRPPRIVAIGASTGGPQVLHEILTALPATFGAPVLVVQHIAPGFALSVVEWLRPQCPLPIQLATAGLRLDRPGIYVAPTGQHLGVRERRLSLTHEPAITGHRPSVTMLFQSIAREYGAAAVGVLLTGMGDDGAIGLRDMKRAGAVTIAQDEASSVIFSMPASAIALGVVDHVLPPFRIAPLLVALTRRSSGA